MLALAIRYLNGFVAATDAANYDRAEWPPHPGRVFMALAAGHFQTGEDAPEREALLWLEQLQPAPMIAAPEAVRRAVVTHYVPVNDKAGPSKALLQSAPLTRDRQARTFARAWLEQDTAFLIWPEAAPERPIRAALESLCSKVTRIGHPSSLVQMWVAEAEEIPEPNWLPDEERAVVRLRLAPAGTLHELRRRYNADRVEAFGVLKVAEWHASNQKECSQIQKRLQVEFPDGPPFRQRPELSISHGYAHPARPAQGALPSGSVFSPHPLVFRLEPAVENDGHQLTPYSCLDLLCALAVTQRWREALCSHSNDLSESARSILSGHDVAGRPLETPHLAFLPFAFVGAEHADGRLLGVGLALPATLSRVVRGEVLTAIGRVRELKIGRLGVWRAALDTSARPPWNLQPEAWTGYPEGATYWSTVTPIVFDRHPRSKDKVAYQNELADMIVRACVNIGLPAPREVVVTPVSGHLGVPPSHRFLRLQRKDGSNRRHAHAILVFSKPVHGPVVIGAGRYRGYGLCRPLLSA